MNVVDKAFETQLKNIQARSGKSLAELTEIIHASALQKHGEIVSMLKQQLGMGHGDANTVAKYYFGSVKETAVEAEASRAADPLDEIYAGPKAALRPIHDALTAELDKMGEYEVSPKKGYMSLRRKKQFAMVGPATNTRVEVGLNMKGIDPTDRLVAEKPGGMCQYKVKMTDPAEIDAELIGWIRTAYESAG